MKALAFAVASVVVGFLVSYATDLARSGRVVWWPPHASDMASGTFLTSLFTYLLFERLGRKA
jgi:hypothetical protein